MLRNRGWLAAVILCCSGAASSAEDAATVLAQCRNALDAFPRESIALKIEKKDGAWRATELSVALAHITDRDMQSVTRLDTLESIELHGPTGELTGAVDGAALARLGAFPHLRRLSLCVALPESGSKTIGNLTELEELVIITHLGEAIDVDRLKGLQKLRRLWLYCNGMNDSALHSLRALIHLEELQVGGTEITDAGLAELSNLASLRRLECGMTLVTRQGIESLKNLPRLEYLECDVAADFSLLRGLRSLSIVLLRSDDDGAVKTLLPENLETLSAELLDAQRLVSGRPLRRLRSLDLYRGSAYNPLDLKWLPALPELRELEIGCEVDGVAEALVGLKSLRVLSLWNVKDRVGDDDMKALAELRGLESLSISGGGPFFTDAGMKALGTLAQLQRLTLRGTGAVTDQGFAPLGRLTRLRSLTLCVGDRLTKPRVDKAFRPADALLDHVQACSELEELALQSGHITDHGLAKLAALKKLRSLNLMSCRGFSDAALASLIDALPNLRIVSLHYGSAEKPVPSPPVRTLRHKTVSDAMANVTAGRGTP